MFLVLKLAEETNNPEWELKQIINLYAQFSDITSGQEPFEIVLAFSLKWLESVYC